MEVGFFISSLIFCSLLYIIDSKFSWHYFLPLLLISQIKKSRSLIFFSINVLFWFIGHKYLWAVVFETEHLSDNKLDIITIQLIMLLLYIALATMCFCSLKRFLFFRRFPIAITTGVWLLLLLAREATSDLLLVGPLINSFFITYSWFQFYLLYALKDWCSIQDKKYAWAFIFPFWGMYPIPLSTGPKKMEVADSLVTVSRMIALRTSAIKMLSTVLLVTFAYLILDKLMYGYHNWLTEMIHIPTLGWPIYTFRLPEAILNAIPQFVLISKFFGVPIHSILMFIIVQGVSVAALRFMGYWNPRGVYQLHHIQSVRDLFSRLQFYINYFLLKFIVFPIFQSLKISKKRKYTRSIVIFFIIFIGALITHFTCDIFIMSSFTLWGALAFFKNGLTYFLVLSFLVASSAQNRVDRVNQFCWYRALVVFFIYCFLRNLALMTRYGGASINEFSKFLRAVFFGI